MTRGTQEIAVVHLVRCANGLEAFDAFLASLVAVEPGHESELVLLFKGFPRKEMVAPYLERAADLRPRAVHVSDEGLDLTAYLAVAGRLEHRRVCFLNSFSEILVPGWLGLLAQAFSDRTVAAAGATGSWASNLSFGLWQTGIPGGYGDVYEDRRVARRAMIDVTGATFRNDWLYWLMNLAFTLRDSPGSGLFPAMHLRTNAFLVERRALLSLRSRRLHTKRATYRLESGRDNLTAQLRARGRSVVVVDRHGDVRHPVEWPAANTFWQDQQQDLLVGDNQTRLYQGASEAQRQVLSRYAWGPQARPGPTP